jgi:hypothetical protein
MMKVILMITIGKVFKKIRIDTSVRDDKKGSTSSILFCTLSL